MALAEYDQAVAPSHWSQKQLSTRDRRLYDTFQAHESMEYPTTAPVNYNANFRELESMIEEKVRAGAPPHVLRMLIDEHNRMKQEEAGQKRPVPAEGMAPAQASPMPAASRAPASQMNKLPRVLLQLLMDRQNGRSVY